MRSLPKNANQVEWPFDRDLGDVLFTEEDKCKKDAFQGEKKSKNKEKKRIKIHPLCGPGEESNYDHEMKLATFLFRWLQNNNYSEPVRREYIFAILNLQLFKGFDQNVLQLSFVSSFFHAI